MPAGEGMVLEGLRHLVLGRPWMEILHDVVDILIVAFIVYRALVVLRGTRAMQMGVGFLIFGLLYLLAKYAEFITLLNVLSWLASSLILIVVVVFQNDIRRALIRMGAKAWFRGAREQQTRVIDEAVDAATELSRHRIGAIIAFERDANILEFARSGGIDMDSLVSRELLVSLFLPESLNKTHDGAVLIRNLRIARAGMFFPMPETRIADPSFGSRHRAAIGITEETDAVVIVVSEERGTVTLCFGGSYVANIDSANLRKTLLEQLGHRPKGERPPLMKRMASGLRRSAEAQPDDEDEPSTAKAAGVKSSPTKASVPDGSSGAASEKRKSGSPASVSLRSSSTSSDRSSESDASTEAEGRSRKDKAASKSDRSKSKKASSGKTKSDKASSDKSDSDKPKSTRTPGLRRGTSPSSVGPGSDGDGDSIEHSKTPPPSRVSKPMPQPKDRKSTTEPVSVEISIEGATGRTSVSKSMLPTELPGSSSSPEGDEP